MNLIRWYALPAVLSLPVALALTVLSCASEPTPTPSPTPTLTPASTPSPTPTAPAAPTPTPTAAPTRTPTPAPTATPTPSPTPTPMATATPSGYPQAEVMIEGSTFGVDVADTYERRRLGLGGREGLARERGMWFDMGGTGSVSFWMRGMRFPIDIVWISEDFVVTGVAERLPFPDAGTPDSSLPVYFSGVPIRYVLEINAGLAEELGIGEGSVVTFTPQP